MKSFIVVPNIASTKPSKSAAAEETESADAAAMVSESEPWDVNFERIFWYLRRTKDKDFLLRPDYPDVIVMQMGKVASTAIYRALGKRGFNAFHCHGLSAHRQQQNLVDILNAEMTPGLTGNRMRRHLFNLALHLMVRWYQKNQRRRGRRLKVISLTRDPVSRYVSVLMQGLEQQLPSILKWQRRRLLLEVDARIELQQAVVDFVSELLSIVAEHAPLDANACRAAAIYAKKRWPKDSIVVTQLRQLLLPLTWFDAEIAPMFGVNALSGGALRDQGWLEQRNDWAEVIILRYERLANLLPEIQRFFELPDLVLDRENVTEEKPHAAEVRPAAMAAFESASGPTAIQALRCSAYGKACGYDLLESSLASPTSSNS